MNFKYQIVKFIFMLRKIIQYLHRTYAISKSLHTSHLYEVFSYVSEVRLLSLIGT